MAKVAVVTDSNSGITQSQAKEMGVFVLPMPFNVDGKDYFEDIDLSQEQFYELLVGKSDIHTSQPSPENVMNLWRDILKDYDEIVHIPMSSGLSGSCQSAMMLSREDEFEGKVFVVDNQRISVTMRQSVLDAQELIKRGKSAAEIKDILLKDKFNSSIYIMLNTLYYLKKGGRITPAAAALGELLKLKPVLQIQGEKLDAYTKARTSAQGKTAMMTAIRNDIINRFGGLEIGPDVHLAIAHTQNAEAAEALKKELLEIYPNCEVMLDPLSLSIACHIGPGALAIACSRKLHYDEV